MIPDVQCPWGGSEFCFRAKSCNPALLIQEQLRRVVLNFPTNNYYRETYWAETSRIDYIRLDNEKPDLVLLNKDWEISPSVAQLKGEGLVVLVSRDHGTKNEKKRLLPHPPRKPFHNLSSLYPNDLSPCVPQPQVVSTVRSRVHNTTSTLSLQASSFAGSSSMSVRERAEGIREVRT